MSADMPAETAISPGALAVFHHRIAAVAESMGLALMRAASGPNIKERRDFSCAAFDARGRLLAQAAHIPVHLGALPAAVAAARARVGAWRPGDVVVLNDPYLGGSHLPDLTTVSAVFAGEGGPAAVEAHAAEGRGRRNASGQPRAAAPEEPVGFVATRAHHADVGGGAPGSLMSARDLFGEGLVLPPVHLARGGRVVEDVRAIVCANSRTPAERRDDLDAQLAAHHRGTRDLALLVARTPDFGAACEALLAWSERLCRARLAALGEGCWSFTDRLDGEVEGTIRVTVALAGGALHADFTGTSPQRPDGFNAPRAVTESAVRYVTACLVGDVPLNEGAFAPVRVTAPPGSRVCALRPAAVAAGNVETSQRIVDALLGALSAAAPGRVPAAGHGTMNNLLVGGEAGRDGRPWAYYETMGGGGGGGPDGPGAAGRQTHMTNTRNTPIEALEHAYPLRVESYALRRGSGGAGRHAGGDGAVRRIRLLADATVTIVSTRRTDRPWGLAGGADGAPGRNALTRADGATATLPGVVTFEARAGEVVEIASPGGGGWGPPAPQGPRSSGTT